MISVDNTRQERYVSVDYTRQENLVALTLKNKYEEEYSLEIDGTKIEVIPVWKWLLEK